MITKQLNEQQPFLNDSFALPRIKGNYFLTGFMTRIDSKNSPFTILQLSDCSTELSIFCRDLSCINGELKPYHLTSIEARPCDAGKGPYMQLKYAESTSSSSIKYLEQLPVSVMDMPELLGELLTLVYSIDDLALRSFCNDVLCLEDIGIKFIQCPASLNHHHNYKCGLLQHSLEVARMFADNKQLPQSDRELGIVAALFHDIGKTKTMTTDLTRTALGHHVDHHDLTLDICSAPLKRLETKHNGFALQLKHAWTCASPGARYGFKARTSVARHLQLFDNQSAFEMRRRNV